MCIQLQPFMYLENHAAKPCNGPYRHVESMKDGFNCRIIAASREAAVSKSGLEQASVNAEGVPEIPIKETSAVATEPAVTQENTESDPGSQGEQPNGKPFKIYLPLPRETAFLQF